MKKLNTISSIAGQENTAFIPMPISYHYLHDTVISFNMQLWKHRHKGNKLGAYIRVGSVGRGYRMEKHSVKDTRSPSPPSVKDPISFLQLLSITRQYHYVSLAYPQARTFLVNAMNTTTEVSSSSRSQWKLGIPRESWQHFSPWAPVLSKVYYTKKCKDAVMSNMAMWW